MNFMNSANRVTGQPKGTAATPTLMLWVIIGVATTTLDAASDGESDRGDKRPLIGQLDSSLGRLSGQTDTRLLLD